MEIILAICVTGSESLEECSLFGKGITFHLQRHTTLLVF